MEAHTLIPSFIKALGFSKEDGDRTLHGILLQVYELVGRYVLPDTYIHYILPRLVGDSAVTQFGIDTTTRVSVMEFLGALLSGSKASELIPHFEALVDALTDSFVINPDSPVLIAAAMDVVNQMLTSMQGRGNAAIHAHFLATGRLTSLKGTVAKVFNWLLAFLNNETLSFQATNGLLALSRLESDTGGSSEAASLKSLFDVYSHRTLTASVAGENQYYLMPLLAESPFHSLQTTPDSLEFTLNFLCVSAEVNNTEDFDPSVSKDLSDLVVSLMGPVAYSCYTAVKCKSAFAHIVKLFPGDSSHVNTIRREALGMGKVDRKAAAAIIMRFLPRVLEAFIFDVKLSLAQTQQVARLNILSVLLASDPSFTESNIFGEEPVYCGDVLTTTFPRVIERALGPAVNPANNQRVRHCAVQLIGSFFLGLIKCWYHNKDFSRLVKPFTYWEGKDSAEATGRRVSQQTAKSGLALALAMLDDSSDAIRESSLAALTCGVALVSNADDDGPSYKIIVSRLLRETAKALSEPQFFKLLEPLLRSLTILSPAIMKNNILRQIEDNSQQPVHLLNDLLDHAELLSDLSA